MTGGRGKRFPVNHYNEMSHLPKGQRSSQGHLFKGAIPARRDYSALPLWPIIPGTGLPSLPLPLQAPPLSGTNQESIAMSQGPHAALTPVDTTVYYRVPLSALLLSNVVLRRHRNGGRQAEEISEAGGGDTLRNFNSDQHV